MSNAETLKLIDELTPVEYRVRPLVEAVMVGLVILMATLTTSYFIYLRALVAQEGEIRQGLLRTAHVAATIIDPTLHQSYRSPEEEQTPAYQAALAPLVKMKESDRQIAYLYTAIRDPDGTVRFVYDVTPTPDKPCAVDAADRPIVVDGCEEDTSVGLLQVYEDAPENLAMLRAFDTRAVSTSDEPYTDQYGTFISGYVPLFDANGTFYGVLGMDIDIKDYLARLKPIKRATDRALVTGFFISFITASVVWFLRNFIRVLNRRRFVLFEKLKRMVMRESPRRSRGTPAP